MKDCPAFYFSTQKSPPPNSLPRHRLQGLLHRVIPVGDLAAGGTELIADPGCGGQLGKDGGAPAPRGNPARDALGEVLPIAVQVQAGGLAAQHPA